MKKQQRRVMTPGINTCVALLVIAQLSGCGDEEGDSKACAEGYKRVVAGCVPVDESDTDTEPAGDTADNSGDPADTGTDSPPQDTASPSDTGGPVDTGASPEPEYEIADCDTPLEGIDWTSASPMLYETGDIEAELAAIDFAALPSAIDISGLDGWMKGTLAYGLDVPVDELGDSLDRDAVLAKGMMGQVVLASIQADGAVDEDVYRRGLFRYYSCSRGFPMTLDGFKAMFGYPSSHVVIESQVKCIERYIARDNELGISYVTAANPEEFEETEIILRNNREDGQIDFLVYGEDGRLTNRSAFPGRDLVEHVVQPTPIVCIECHSSRTMDGFSLDPVASPDVLDPRVYGLCP